MRASVTEIKKREKWETYRYEVERAVRSEMQVDKVRREREK